MTVLEETSDTRTLLGVESRRSPVNASSRRASLEAICVTVRQDSVNRTLRIDLLRAGGTPHDCAGSGAVPGSAEEGFASE
jgi:hypothetical protein